MRRIPEGISDAVARRPDIVPWLIAAYYVAAVILRVLRSEALQSDEAEQLFQSQFLLMGYGRQPPFYNWLQYGVIQLVGPSILALSLVKNTLLFLTCLFSWLSARILLKDRRLAAVAMLGVIAMPAVSVMAQRDLTHAVATLFTTALFTYAFLLTLTRPHLGSYLLAGAAVGFGLISKYNFVIVPVAAILAILPEADLRKRIFDWRLGAALAVAAAICLPHGLWVLGNLSEATQGTIAAMREDASGNAVSDRLSGLRTLFIGALAGGLPVFGVFLLAFRGSLLRAWRATNVWTRVTGRSILIGLAVVGLIGLAFGASTISEKWLSPFLLLLPLYLCLKIEAANAETTHSVGRFLFPVAVLALGFVVYIAAGNVIGPLLGAYTKENLPSGPFIEEVMARHGGAKPAYVITGDPFLAASARLKLPQARIVLPNAGHMAPLGDTWRRQTGLAVWRIDDGSTSLPAGLAPVLQRNGIAAETLMPSAVALPHLFSFGDDRVTFGYAWITASGSPP